MLPRAFIISIALVACVLLLFRAWSQLCPPGLNKTGVRATLQSGGTLPSHASRAIPTPRASQKHEDNDAAANQPPVLALAFFGMLPRVQETRDSRCDGVLRGLETLKGLVLPSIRDAVLEPSSQLVSSQPGFREVHVYGHTNVDAGLYGESANHVSCPSSSQALEARLRTVLHDTLSSSTHAELPSPAEG